MKTIVHLILFFSSLSCLGQELYHRTLNSDNGLPSNKVHYVYEDSKGYVWFGTENGACRWDSKNFVYYTIKDGLPNNEVLVIYEDSKGRIWFSTFSNELCYLYHDTIFNKENDKRLEKISIIKGGELTEYKGELYYFSHQNKYKLFSLDVSSLFSRLKNNMDFSGYGGSPLINFFKNQNFISTLSYVNSNYYSQLYYADKSYVSPYKIIDWESDQIKIIDYKSRMCIKLQLLNYTKGLNTLYNYSMTTDSSILLVKKLNGTSVYQYLNKFYKPFVYSKYTKILYQFNYSLEDDLLYFHLYRNQAIKICRGSLKIPNGVGYNFNYKLNFSRLLNNKIFNLTKNDVNIINNTLVVNYNDIKNKDEAIHKLAKINRELFIVMESSNLYNVAKKSYSSLGIDSKLYNLDIGENQMPYITSFQEILNIQNRKKLVNKLTPSGFYFKGFSYSPKHKLYTINNSQQGLFLQDLNKKATKISDLYAYTSFIDSRDRLWVGTTNKLYVSQQFLPQVKGEKEVKLNSNQDIFCSEIKEDHKGNLFFTTNDGIYVLDKQDRTYHVSDQNFLSSNECVTLKLDTQTQNFIVATKNGVNQIHYETQKGSLTFRVVNKFFKEDGLSSNEIKDILIDGDSLWVATAKGLDLINDKAFHPDTLKIPIHINKVYVNDSLWTLDSTYRLDYTQNNLKIDYSAIYYQRRDRLDIRYRLIKDGDTTNGKLNDNLLNLFSLASGDYILQLYAYDRDYPYIRSDYRTLRFTISPPYYKTWWFYSLILLGSLSLLGGFLWYRNKIKLEKLQAESELHRLTLHGLQNQMNPHFVFNALNTLQHFIVKKDNLNSLNFLSDFSTLIRKILDNSRSLFISLEEEITFLKQYTQIEGERYGNRFRIDFEIEIEEDELTDIRIPPMLIQPLIENAIKHGVSSMEEGGEIQIRFRLEEEDVLKVEVIDNGAGIKDMGKKTSSKAVTILRERLALIKDKSRKGEYILERQGDKTHSILYIPI